MNVIIDVIICFKFCRNRLRGFRDVRGQKWGSSIDFDSRPYNRSALPCCLRYDICLHPEMFLDTMIIMYTWQYLLFAVYCRQRSLSAVLSVVIANCSWRALWLQAFFFC